MGIFCFSDHLITTQITYSPCTVGSARQGFERVHFSNSGVIFEKRGEGLTRERERPINRRPGSEEI
jgi:hypothetical protein